MSPIVADESVALKWAIDEELFDRVEALFKRHCRTGPTYLCPAQVSA